MTTEDDLRLAMQTAFEHCAPGGVVLFCPDYVAETFTVGTDHGGEDGDDVSFRFLEWTWDPDPSDTTYIADYMIAVRREDGSLEVDHDRHVEGLFPTATWLRLLDDVGFRDPRALPLEHSDVEPGVHYVFAAVKS